MLLVCSSLVPLPLDASLILLLHRACATHSPLAPKPPAEPSALLQSNPPGIQTPIETQPGFDCSYPPSSCDNSKLVHAPYSCAYLSSSTKVEAKNTGLFNLIPALCTPRSTANKHAHIADLCLHAWSIGPPVLQLQLLFALVRAFPSIGGLSVSLDQPLSLLHKQHCLPPPRQLFLGLGSWRWYAPRCLSHVMASSKSRLEKQHAYHNILSPAPAHSRSAAYHNPLRQRAPESDYSCIAIPEDPPSTFASCPRAESFLRNPVADFSTSDPLVRRYREARVLPRVFADSRRSASRHVTSSQLWPPRRDSLNTRIPGVR